MRRPSVHSMANPPPTRGSDARRRTLLHATQRHVLEDGDAQLLDEGAALLNHLAEDTRITRPRPIVGLLSPTSTMKGGRL